MEHLTEEYWDKFKKTDKRDGKLFEKFIKELLSFEYPDYSFVPTKQTRDGAKDITSKSNLLFGKEISLWMECKNYSDKLSFNDISSTLLMAYLDDVKQLIIFSYSPVNSEFMKYIARYKDRTKIDVKIFDDIALEQLILKNINKFDKFNDYFPKFKIPCKNFQFNCDQFDCDYILKSQSSSNSGMPLFLDLNDELELDLYVKNSTSKIIEFTTKLEADNFDDYFEIISNKYNEIECKINPYSADIFSYKIIIKKFKKDLKLPYIVLNFNNKIRKLEIKRKYDCRWLAETKLIGKNHKSQLKLIQEYITTNLNTSIITLCGKSGTGKSRILKEINFFMSKLNKKIFSFDTDLINTSSRKFLKSLISELDEIPDFDEGYKPSDISFSSNSNYYKTIAYNIMYNQNYIIEDNIQEISDYLFEQIINKDITIIIDNVQNFDETTIFLIEDIITQLKNKKTKSTFVISFNYDKLHISSKAFQLCKKMQLFSSLNPKQFLYKEILEFSKDDAIEYITECLCYNGSNKLQYERTIEKIINRIGLNPFFIRNYLIYLYQNQIIERSEYNNFYILDFDKFKKSFEELPTEILILIDKRENLFYKKLNIIGQDVKKYHNFFYVLSLCKSLPLEMYYALFQKEMLEHLLDTGFIICINNSITFAHQIYEEYFSNKFQIAHFPNDYALTVINSIETLALTEDMFFQYFILKYIVNKIDYNLFISAVRKIINYTIETNFYKHVFNIIDKYIKCEIFKLDCDMKIVLYNLMFSKTHFIFGINEALHYTKTIYEDFLVNYKKYIKVIDILFKTLKEYLTSQLNIGDYQSSLNCNQKILEILINKLDNFDNKNILVIQLYNCQAMAYHHMDKLDDAIIANDNAIKLSKKIKNIELLSTSWRERGNIYYHSSKAHLLKDKICECWENAYNIAFSSLEDYENYDLYFVLSSCMKFVLANLIAHKLDYLNDIIEFVSNHLEKTTSLYHEINMRYLIVIYYINIYDININIDKELYSEIIKLLDEAIDYSGIYGNYNYYAYGFYLKGLISYLSSNIEEVYDNFIVVLNLINQNFKFSIEKNKWKYIISDMINLLKQYNMVIPNELKCLLGITKSESKPKHILSIKNDKLGFPQIF